MRICSTRDLTESTARKLSCSLLNGHWLLVQLADLEFVDADAVAWLAEYEGPHADRRRGEGALRLTRGEDQLFAVDGRGHAVVPECEVDGVGLVHGAVDAVNLADAISVADADHVLDDVGPDTERLHRFRLGDA